MGFGNKCYLVVIVLEKMVAALVVYAFVSCFTLFVLAQLGTENVKSREEISYFGGFFFRGDGEGIR